QRHAGGVVMAAQVRPRDRFAGKLSHSPGALSREEILAWRWLLLRVRSAGLSPRLARGPVGARAEQKCDVAHRLCGLMAAVECAERLREALAETATAALCRDRRATVEDQRSGSSRAAVPRLARIS